MDSVVNREKQTHRSLHKDTGQAFWWITKGGHPSGAKCWEVTINKSGRPFYKFTTTNRRVIERMKVLSIFHGQGTWQFKKFEDRVRRCLVSFEDGRSVLFLTPGQIWSLRHACFHVEVDSKEYEAKC